MKSNIIKYIFAAFVIALIGFAGYQIYQEDSKKQNATVPVEEIKQEPNIAKDLRLAIAGYDTINPILSNNKNVQDVTKLIFEPLLTLDENYKLQSCLATEWSQVGDTAYLLKLRTDVKWQDGTKFTAQDVRYTIDRLKEIPSIYSYNVQHVIEVSAIDENTVKITIDAPIPFFEYNLTFPILSESYYAEQDFKTTEKNSVLVGTGMYKIISNDNRIITLKKNEDWWNKKEKNAKIETITVNLYSSMGEVYNNFKMGNIDLVCTEAINLEEYVGSIGYQKKEIKGREFDFLAFNCQKSILDKTEIRKAIGYGIDKNGILANVYQGKYYTATFPLDYGIWAYSNENTGSGYNPEQAKQILIDNGWTYKYDYWQKTENYKTIRLSFNLLVNSDNSNRVLIAEKIKEDLEKIGIKVKINSVNTKRFQDYLNSRNYDMVLTGTNSGLSPDLTTYFGNANLANYQNEEVTAIMNDLPNIKEDNLLKEKIKRISEITSEDMPYSNLFFNKKTVIYSTNLIGDVTPNNYNLFYHIENWYRQY